jgi:hypothetical protein
MVFVGARRSSPGMLIREVQKEEEDDDDCCCREELVLLPMVPDTAGVGCCWRDELVAEVLVWRGSSKSFRSAGE